MAVTGLVGVVGLGLVGGSVARRLVDAGIPAVGYDPSASARRAAAAAGIACVDSVAALGERDPAVVLLAAPLRAMRSALAEIAREVPRAVVADLGSVKGAVRDAARAVGLDSRYVGAHPMAGTERSGFAASTAELLVGAPWALTVDETTDPGAFWAVLELVTGPFAGEVRILADDVHDESVALISHVPHVLATELLGLVAEAPVQDVARGLAAGSFRDGTRVARSDPRRTEAMVTDNAGWVASALRVVIRDLELLVEGLETNAPVGEFFDRGGPLRSALVPPGGDTVRVRIGEPGWAAALTEAGAAGAVVVAVDAADRSVTLAR